MDVGLEAAHDTRVLSCHNYAEEWEHDIMEKSNDTNESKFSDKYRGVHFFDHEADEGPEVRRIAFIEWHIVTPGQRRMNREAKSCYTIATMCVERNGEVVVADTDVQSTI